MQHITMLAAFGSPPRGVSFYSDQLIAALRQLPQLEAGVLDYVSLYPSFLLPAAGGKGPPAPENAVVRWNSPSSWRQAAHLSAPVMHMQYWSSLSAHYLHAIAQHLRRQNKRCIVTVHNPDPHEAIPLTGYMEKRLLYAADRLVVHSASGRDILSTRYPRLKEKIRVIPHGIVRHPSTVAEPGDRELAGLRQDRRYVLIFGNLRGYKGVPTLLKAWKRVVRECADADLLIAGRFWNKGRNPASRVAAFMLGTGRTAREITTLLEDRELRHRVILREQFLPDEVIDACCRVADVAVFPYDRFSGQSGAATRAAGWGLPLVVSRVGALPDLAVDERFVCMPGDDAGLARILVSFLSDSGRSADARKEQLARVEPFCWDHVAQQHLAMYSELAVQAIA